MLTLIAQSNLAHKSIDLVLVLVLVIATGAQFRIELCHEGFATQRITQDAIGLGENLDRPLHQLRLVTHRGRMSRQGHKNQILKLARLCTHYIEVNAAQSPLNSPTSWLDRDGSVNDFALKSGHI